MSDMTLFDVPDAGAVRVDDPHTSVEAARTCDAQRQRDILRRELAAHPEGLTADDLQAITGVPRYIAATRLNVMRKAGECEPWGTRTNDAGRNVQLWHIRKPWRMENVHVAGERL